MRSPSAGSYPQRTMANLCTAMMAIYRFRARPHLRRLGHSGPGRMAGQRSGDGAARMSLMGQTRRFDGRPATSGLPFVRPAGLTGPFSRRTGKPLRSFGHVVGLGEKRGRHAALPFAADDGIAVGQPRPAHDATARRSA
jgi:hypothetical protein